MSEHERAAQRLDAAVEEQTRAREKREQSPEEARTDASLRGADDEVLARKRWLQAVDDHDY
jgi:hypothetical protein